MAKSWTILLHVIAAFTVCLPFGVVPKTPKEQTELPTVFIPLFVRNKAHTLPEFFGCFERLNYPKQRMFLWIRSDHNVDNTTAMLQEWVNGVQKLYHKIDFEYQPYPQRYSDESGPMDWTQKRYDHIISLREHSLQEARKQWADYMFTIDTDNFLVDPDVLWRLIDQDKTIIAPMLESTTMYSNFWGGMNENGYYRRTEMYVEILQRNITGIFVVPMVHSTVLINMRHSTTKGLTYSAPPGYKGDIDDMLIFAYSARQSANCTCTVKLCCNFTKGLTYSAPPGYKGDIDDMLIFAYSARQSGIPMYVMNKRHYGQLLVPTAYHESLEDEIEQMIHVRLETMVEKPPLPTSDWIYQPERPVDKLGMDEVYMINLKRRPLRRQRMMHSLKLLGIQARAFDAVDGKALTSDDLIAMGIDMLPGYRDPYSERVLTKGEIGCFMSHYRIWQEMVQKNYNQIMVLEDDVRFDKGFRPRLLNILYDVAINQIDWDLIYVGRKILNVDEEEWVHGIPNFVKPSYSYWTLGYILSLRGAKKLLAQEPLGRMVPVDEYFPILFDKHPEADWASAFWPRDLKTFSVNPLLVQPTHYVGDNNYFSDTETSNIWEDVIERENGRGENEKKGDPGIDSENLDEDQNLIKTPAGNAKSDQISDGFNNTGQTKEKNIEERKTTLTTDSEKTPKNEKASEAVEQGTPSKSDAADRRHTEL